MNINSNEIIQINKPETQEKNNEPTVKKVAGRLRVLQTEPQVAEKTLKITETRSSL
jgi:hypothetical protein